MTIDRATLEQLMVDAGHVINKNNGQCALIEDFACRVTGLCDELLKGPKKIDNAKAVVSKCGEILSLAYVLKGNVETPPVARMVVADLERIAAAEDEGPKQFLALTAKRVLVILGEGPF